MNSSQNWTGEVEEEEGLVVLTEMETNGSLDETYLDVLFMQVRWKEGQQQTLKPNSQIAFRCLANFDLYPRKASLALQAPNVNVISDISTRGCKFT